MIDPYCVIGPLLRRIPPEAAHRVSLKALASGLRWTARHADDSALSIRLWNRDFSNPIGLAAGYDKDAEVPVAALRLGFGFVEVGTITPRPQPGNPRPRLFRLVEDEAAINRMGFNSGGLDAAAERLRVLRAAGLTVPGFVGANVGKNRDSADAAADYAAGAAMLAPMVDYLVINVSSPNTPGLRELQRQAALTDLIEQVRCAMADVLPRSQRSGPPLLVKVAPDLSPDERADIAAVAANTKIDGLIIGNTTTSRPPGLKSRHAREAGGLSGRPLFALSTDVLSDMYSRTGGRVPLIGAGGVASGADAYAKIRAGASLVQLYTALVYRGPGLVAAIKRDLAACLRRDGFASLSEAVGAGHRSR